MCFVGYEHSNKGERFLLLNRNGLTTSDSEIDALLLLWT